jgi:sugar-specific transcriptional regulator TrmB
MSTLDKEEIIKLLIEFGLDEMQSKIYLYLIVHGASKASQISKTMGIKKGTIYEILNVLKNKGFVKSTLEVPAKFIAEEPELALKTNIITKKDEFVHLNKIFKPLVSRLKCYFEPSNNTSNNQFVVLSGKQSICNQIARIFQVAQGEVFIVTTIGDIAKMYFSSIPEFIKKMEKKIVIKIITELTSKSDIELIRRIGVKHAKDVTLPAESRTICTKEHVLVTTVSTNDKSVPESGFVSNSRHLISNTYFLCKDLWESGIDVFTHDKPRDAITPPTVVTSSPAMHKKS